jgi:hypothetical protein
MKGEGRRMKGDRIDLDLISVSGMNEVSKKNMLKNIINV